MVPSSVTVRQVLAAQYAEDRRGAARSTGAGRRPRSLRRALPFRSPLAALRARRVAAARPTLRPCATC